MVISIKIRNGVKEEPETSGAESDIPDTTSIGHLSIPLLYDSKYAYTILKKYCKDHCSFYKKIESTLLKASILSDTK